jgi:hypothetical protein
MAGSPDTVVQIVTDDMHYLDELAKWSSLDIRSPEPGYGEQFVLISVDILHGRRTAAGDGVAQVSWARCVAVGRRAPGAAAGGERPRSSNRARRRSRD